MESKEFSVPYYIFEEIVEYVELSAKGINKNLKWENIKSLINLAIVNEHITREQGTFLTNKYSRE